MVRQVNNCTTAYTLSINMKYTMAYIAVHNIICVICFLKLPLLVPIAKMAMVAIQLQSDGKVIRHMTNVIKVFCHVFQGFWSCMYSKTNPHAKDHTTPVWLNTVVWNGIKGMPKQKLYAKWDIAANRNNLAAYFRWKRLSWEKHF